MYRDAYLGFPPADDVDPDEQAADAARFRSSDERIKSELLDRALGETGLRVEPALRSTFLGTCVGLVEALRQAQDWLERGACDRCIVGAVDSLVDANVLAPLSLLGLLKTVARPVGMLPGEAAAFHVLRRAPSGAQPPADVRALVGVPMAATGLAHPLMHPQPVNREETLASAISQAVAATFGGRFDGVVVSNLNGDAYRATSWSQVWLHLRNVAGFAVPSIWYPETGFGDVGAAAGPVSIAMLVHAFARGQAPSSQALVCLFDDTGGRCVIPVQGGAE